MARLIKIADTKDLAPGQGGLFDIEGERIVVFNVDGRYYAVEDMFTRQQHAPAAAPTQTRFFHVRSSGNDLQVEL